MMLFWCLFPESIRLQSVFHCEIVVHVNECVHCQNIFVQAMHVGSTETPSFWCTCAPVTGCGDVLGVDPARMRISSVHHDAHVVFALAADRLNTLDVHCLDWWAGSM
jgi:hypothetical protein